jgi:hypothetical protein
MNFHGHWSLTVTIRHPNTAICRAFPPVPWASQAEGRGFDPRRPLPLLAAGFRLSPANAADPAEGIDRSRRSAEVSADARGRIMVACGACGRFLRRVIACEALRPHEIAKGTGHAG